MVSNLVCLLDLKKIFIDAEVIQEKTKWTISFSRKLMLPRFRALYMLNGRYVVIEDIFKGEIKGVISYFFRTNKKINLYYTIGNKERYIHDISSIRFSPIKV